MKLTKDEVLSILEKEYPSAACELNFENPFELLVAVVLSAQCTDKRVNQVTENLFKVCSNPIDFVKIDIKKLEEYIYSCGFYHNKAKAIKELSKSLIEKYDGVVPCDIDELRKLKGVGRKTANVVYAVAFGGEAIAVDTHVFRVSNRLKIAEGKTPLEVEKKLMDFFDKNTWSKAHHLLLFHGRYTCKSQSPNCENCMFKEKCEFKEKKCTK